MLLAGRLLDQPPFFLGVIRKHLSPQRFLAGAPGRNVILFGHRNYGSTMPDNSGMTIRGEGRSTSTANYYIACWIGYGTICRCGHQHPSIRSAMPCLIFEDSFMRVVIAGRERSLDAVEMQVFRRELIGRRLAGFR